MSQPQRGLTTTANSNALAISEGELIAVLRSSIYPGATDSSIKMVISYCTTAGLDPMLKPVHIVPMNVKKPGSRDYEWRDVIMPGIGLYRIQASRTGHYLGKTEPEFGPDITKKLGNKEVTFPQWCRVTVRKAIGQHIAEFTAKELWVENYATAKDTDAPNAMWGKRPYGQLAKVAEAQALRQAFPELLGGTQTADEMEGKSMDEGREMVDITPAPKPSAAKAALDSFAGKPKEAPPAATAPFYDPVAEDDPFEPSVDEQTGEIVVMPKDAADAFRESGKWMAAWKWLSMTLPEQSKPVAMAIIKEHWPVLQTVAKYRDTYKKSVNDLLTLCDSGLTIDAEAA